MKNYISKLTFIFILLFTINACNKDIKYSNQLDGQDYHIHYMLIDTDTLRNEGDLKFNNCRSRNNICTGKLIAGYDSSDVSSAEFDWQFNENGTLFTFSNQTVGNTDASIISSQLSGVYNVVSRTKEEFEFTSTSAPAFPGKKVTFKLIKEHEDH